MVTRRIIGLFQIRPVIRVGRRRSNVDGDGNFCSSFGERPPRRRIQPSRSSQNPRRTKHNADSDGNRWPATSDRNLTPYFSGLACSRLNIQVPITDESSLARVSAKVTYTNPQATPSTATLTATLNDSGKGVWATSLTSIPQTVTQVVVKVTASDIYGFSSTSESRINRTNSC